MSFLNSIMFWGVMAGIGVAIPVFIHLFSRYRSRPMDWAAMELLRRAMVVRARRMRLEDMILLALRILAGVLVAMALARPTLMHTNLSLGGGGADVAVVVALDGSYSMGHQPGVQSRFDLARKRTEDIFKTLSPGDPVTLVLMGDQPRILLRNVAYDPEQMAKVLKRLEPLSEGLNLDAATDELKRLVAEMKAATTELYLVTDAQAVTWKDLSTATRKALVNLGETSNVYLVPVGPEKAEDIAITRLVVASGTQRKGSVVRYLAEVRNAGWRPVDNVVVRLHVDGMAVDQQTVSIAAGATESVPFFSHFETAGTFAVSAHLPEDALAADNARYAITDIRDRVRVLCVDGSPSSEAFGGHTGYLRAALAPFDGRGGGRSITSTIDVRVVGIDGLHAETLSETDVVIMANVPELSRGQALALASFVHRGGGVMVFLGAKIAAGLTNQQMLDADGTPLLPAQIGSVVGSDEVHRPGIDRTPAQTTWQFDSEIPIHPVTSFLRMMKSDYLKGIRFRQYMKLTPHKDARILLKLSPGGDPLLLEKSFGRGKVLLVATTANRDWSEMVVHPSYLMMTQQAVAYLTRRACETPLAVSNTPVFELPSGERPKTATATGPDGKPRAVSFSERDGRTTAVLGAAEKPGVYTLRYDDGVAEMKLAVNVSAAESSVEVLRGGDLEMVADSLSARLIPEGRDVGQAVRDFRLGRELWRALLMIALIALVVEAILSHWFVQRMAVSSRTSVAKSPAA